MAHLHQFIGGDCRLESIVIEREVAAADLSPIGQRGRSQDLAKLRFLWATHNGAKGDG
jgi:hypothetical protein